MSGAKKPIKINKGRNVRSNGAVKNEEHIGSHLKISQNKSKFVYEMLLFIFFFYFRNDSLQGLLSTLNTNQVNGSSGLVLSIHPLWPELPQNQSELFFECTLFLYSVLALFLQYLNLYKTLWWLPKSHWHTSMVFVFLINYKVLFLINYCFLNY